MSAVTPACSHTHLLKSAHQVSFSFSHVERGVSSRSRPRCAENPAVRVLYGSQSVAKLVDAGVSLVPTWLSAMLAIAWSRSAWVAGCAGASGVALADAAALIAARAGAGNAVSARLAAARCVAIEAVQPAGSASPHAFFSVAGSPSPQP